MRIRTHLWLLPVLLASLVAEVGIAQITGDAMGLAPSGLVCHNLTTGQRVVSSTAASDWDCAALGLLFDAGDRVETGLRGLLSGSGKAGGLSPAALPPDFVEHAAVVDPEISGGGAAGDLDGDGDIDVLVADQFSWFENLGGADPTFTKHSMAGDVLLGGVSSTSLMDVDQDQRLDIIAGDRNSGTTFRLSWFRNDGADPPDFNERLVDQEQGWSFYDGKGSDVDGDGDTDFFVIKEQRTGCGGSCTTEFVWLEDVGGAYARHVIAVKDGSGNDAFRILATDADNDGDPDLVVADRLDDVLAWYENEGTDFGQEHLIASQLPFFSVRAADIDGDGDTDLANAAGSDDTFHWFENLGDGNFVTHLLDVFAGHLFAGIAVADLSGDGKPDIILSDFPDAVWLENDGGSPPAFDEHALAFTSDPNVRIVGDVDLDGRLDLIRSFSDELTWYENRIGLRLSVTGLAIREFRCRNRTTGQRLRTVTTDTAIDCENEGLVVNPGDEIEVFARGVAE